MAEDDDAVFRALADSTRRHLLDRLFERDGRTLTELESELAMTRFGVMKHLRVLEHPQVLHHAEAGHLEAFLELSQRAPVALEQPVEQVAAGRVGERLEHPVVVLHAGHNR